MSGRTRQKHPSLREAIPYTDGRRVVMVGGAVRAERRSRLRRRFHAKKWDWVPTGRNEGLRTVASLVERIRRGSPDLIVCLIRFLSHAASRLLMAAAAEAGVPCAIVKRGYGDVAIAQAVKVACAPRHGSPPRRIS